MWKPLKNVARGVLEAASAQLPKHREALEIAKLESAAQPRPAEPCRRHLDAAISWILRAQKATGDGGVAWGYRSRAPVRSKEPLGWLAAYPETTGYIIPTMLRYGKLTGDAGAQEAARKMVEWEMRIQLPDGGTQGGVYGAQPVSSSTFVTGQVLFGFIAAYKEWGEPGCRDAAVRAGDFLVACLDDSGRFAKGYSHFSAPGPKAYEVRTGLALAELGVLLDEPKYKRAASRIADYTLSCQRDNGWFQENDLDYHEKPLTHTIGYVMEGLHGIGGLFNRQDCLDAAGRTLTRIAKLTGDDGMLPGRWFHDWKPAADWACLTGSAQLAGVLLRIERQGADAAYLEAAHKLLGFLCFTQDLKIDSPGLAGGIRGSYPFGGDYGQWCVLNWAAKFFADSLMDYLSNQARRG